MRTIAGGPTVVAMATASAPTTSGPPTGGAGIGAARVFASDAQIGLIALNQMRLIGLRRVFGATPEQANALTFVLMLMAAEGTLRGASRVARARPKAGDAAMGGFVMREAALSVAGPATRDFPLLGTLLAGAMIAGIALPEIRRAAHGLRMAEHRLRMAEHRVREQRMRFYGAVGQAAEQIRDAVT
jgi:hypothetical protein